MVAKRIYGEIYLLVVFLFSTHTAALLEAGDDIDASDEDIVGPPRCNGAEYNDVCYWTTSFPNNSSSPECPGGELGIVSDSTTWNYVTGKLAAEIGKYASLKLGLGSSPTFETGTIFYDLYGRSLPGLGQPDSTRECFIWDISKLVIKGVSCGGLSFKYRALCSFGPTLDEEKNCTGVGGVEINSKCFWISATTFSGVENSQLFCFQNEGYLAPISDLQELDLILNSPLLIDTGKDKTKDISLGLTIYKNDWTTLQGETPEYFRFVTVPETADNDKSNCAYVNKEGYWEVAGCGSSSYSVVCQKKPDYWYHLEKLRFYAADKLCVSMGGRLAVPNNLQEHMAILSVISEWNNGVWVGITRHPWYTYTGELVQWFNWDNLEDKDLIDCVIIDDFKSPFTWRDIRCSRQEDYGLCAKDVMKDDNCITAIYNNTTCYWVTSRDVTASQADEQCRSNGGSLAVLTSSLTDDFLTSSFPVLSFREVWIGITKLKKRWYSGIGEQTWFNWYKSGRSSPFTVESCVTFSAKNNFQWSVGCPVVSANDTLQPGNFCMKKLNSTMTTETPTIETTQQTTVTDRLDIKDTSMTESHSSPFVTEYWTETTAPPGSLNTSSSDKESSTMSSLTVPATMASPTTALATEPITSSLSSAATTGASAAESTSTLQSLTTAIAIVQTTSPVPSSTASATESTTSSLTYVPTTAPPVSSPTNSPTTSSGFKQSTQPLEPILSPLNKCGVKIAYPSTGRFWNIPCLCSCNICKKRPNFRNISDAAVVEEIKSKIKKTLTVPKDKISALLNKKISQVDERASSTSIGLVSTCVLVTILAFFVISDVIKIIYTVKNIWTALQ